MARLEGKVALITGAASGIGAASALRMASEGAAVMCADIDLAGAEQTAATIAERGGSSAALKLDVGDAAAVEDAIRQTDRELGGFHVLYNNAGISGLNADWATVLRVNLDGVYNGLFYGCKALAARGGGSIINTASIAGLVGLVSPSVEGIPRTEMEYGAGAYLASKGGVVQLTRQFAVWFAPEKVRVNAIAPGYIETPMTAPFRGEGGWTEYLAALHPLGRLGKPEEIAAAAAFLASDDASFITGVILPVDGGYTAR